MFPQRIHCSEDKCQPLGTSRMASRFLAIKKGLFISEYCWNPWDFLSSLTFYPSSFILKSSVLGKKYDTSFFLNELYSTYNILLVAGV